MNSLTRKEEGRSKRAMAGSNKHALTSPSAQDAQPSSKRAKVVPQSFPKPALNRWDCNLDFTVEVDGITGSALHGEGFAYCWSGARANVGVKGGRYCFACKVLENQDVVMEDTPKEQQNLCRLGISRGDGDVGCLGESLYSFGYGGTGKFSNNGSFLDYGEKFSVGDTIVCAVDLESKPRAKILFAKNGRCFGVAKEFDVGSNGLGITGSQGYERALFPHVLLKNVKVRVLLSIDHGLIPLDGYKPWDAAIEDGNAVEGPKAADFSACEVIMMVGVPGSGKTTWAEKWAKEHPEKRYMLLGTNLALDQMKVPGLMRKRNYGERFDLLMDRATKIFNQLLDRAAKTPRNYILDQTNVYRSARIRKLKPFRNFRKIAVVIFPAPDELKRRTVARSREMGKEVPAEAVNEMIANYVIPKSKSMLNSVEPFEEVWFPELQSDAAEKYLAEMKAALPPMQSRKGDHKSTQSMSIQDRNSREGSQVSVHGNYTSSYELHGHSSRVSQDWTGREASRTLSQGRPSPYSYQSSFATYDQIPRVAPQSSLGSYGHNPRMSQDQGLLEASPLSQSSLAGHYSREGSVQSHSGYYGRATQATYGGPHSLPDQPLHSTHRAGDHAGHFASPASTWPSMGTRMHGDYLPPNDGYSSHPNYPRSIDPYSSRLPPTQPGRYSASPQQLRWEDPYRHF